MTTKTTERALTPPKLRGRTRSYRTSGCIICGDWKVAKATGHVHFRKTDKKLIASFCEKHEPIEVIRYAPGSFEPCCGCQGYWYDYMGIAIDYERN